MRGTINDVQSPTVRLKFDQHPLTVKSPVVRNGVIPNGIPSGTNRRLNFQRSSRINGVLVDDNDADEFFVNDCLPNTVESRSRSDIQSRHVVQI